MLLIKSNKLYFRIYNSDQTVPALITENDWITYLKEEPELAVKWYKEYTKLITSRNCRNEKIDNKINRKYDIMISYEDCLYKINTIAKKNIYSLTDYIFYKKKRVIHDLLLTLS